MTTQELICELTKYPPETRVVVQGYEGGFDDISVVQPISVQPNSDTAWYYGDLISVSDGGEKAALLFGSARSEN
jgi:hypothetical protein